MFKKSHFTKIIVYCKNWSFYLHVYMSSTNSFQNKIPLKFCIEFSFLLQYLISDFFSRHHKRHFQSWFLQFCCGNSLESCRKETLVTNVDFIMMWTSKSCQEQISISFSTHCAQKRLALLKVSSVSLHMLKCPWVKRCLWMRWCDVVT